MSMYIYIEDFLLQNFLIDFCVLRLVYLTSKPQTSTLRLVFASILGACFSLTLTNWISSTNVLVISNLIASSFVTLIAFKSPPKQSLYNQILYLTLSFSLVGAINFFGTQKHITPNGIICLATFNLNLCVSIIIIATYLCELVCKQLKQKLANAHYIYTITLKNSTQQINTQAYLDSGNLITHNGKQVILLDIYTFLKLYNINLLDFALMDAEQITISTASGQKCLKLFTIEEIIIKGTKTKTLKNQYIAINTNNMFKNTNYHALLPNGII